MMRAFFVFLIAIKWRWSFRPSITSVLILSMVGYQGFPSSINGWREIPDGEGGRKKISVGGGIPPIPPVGRSLDVRPCFEINDFHSFLSHSANREIDF